MKPGQQCDPYEADNFFEARSTVESDDLNLPKGRVDPVQYAAAELRLIVAYWTRMATLQAECELAEPTLNEPDDDDE